MHFFVDRETLFRDHFASIVLKILNNLNNFWSYLCAEHPPRTIQQNFWYLLAEHPPRSYDHELFAKNLVKFEKKGNKWGFKLVFFSVHLRTHRSTHWNVSLQIQIDEADPYV